MPIPQFSDKLLATPLFQGMGKADLQDIMGNTKFSFAKYGEGDIITKADTPCRRLIFLLSGTISATTVSANHSYWVTEKLSAPLQLEPERLFGHNMTFTATRRAVTQCNTMSLSKMETVDLYNTYEVFRINLLNVFTTKLQRAEDSLWTSHLSSLRMRITLFITRHSTYPAGEKILGITMNTLALELGESRRKISDELRHMQGEGLVRLSRGVIAVPALEALYGNIRQ